MGDPWDGGRAPYEADTAVSSTTGDPLADAWQRITEQRELDGLTWPALHNDCRIGLAGDIVKTLEPHSEADPAALLVHLLVMFGNAVGSGPHMRVGGARHPARLFAVIAADTARGRKGQASADIRPVLEAADPQWASGRILGGLASGEGLIAAVRDPDGDPETPTAHSALSAGVTDRRLLIHEPEFARTLAVASRDGNIVSAVLRDGWDTGNMRVLTRRDPLVATNAHISVIGHITADELRKRLTSMDAHNGFANRFLWVAARRSKLLPAGGCLDPRAVNDLGIRLRDTLYESRKFTAMSRDWDAEEAWCALYARLATQEPYGLVGALTARAEAQTLRLSVLYALLDRSNVIRVKHVRAAEMLWDYCEQSTRLIFGDALGDPIADRLLLALKAAGEDGLTRNEQRDLFSRHATAEQLDRARDLLVSLEIAEVHTVPTGGRPAEITRVRPPYEVREKRGKRGKSSDRQLMPWEM